MRGASAIRFNLFPFTSAHRHIPRGCYTLIGGSGKKDIKNDTDARHILCVYRLRAPISLSLSLSLSLSRRWNRPYCLPSRLITPLAYIFHGRLLLVKQKIASKQPNCNYTDAGVAAWPGIPAVGFISRPSRKWKNHNSSISTHQSMSLCLQHDAITCRIL